MSKFYTNLSLAGAAAFICGIIALVIGWVLNIIAIFGSMDAPLTAKFIIRCIGIFVGPLGGVMGYL